MTDPFIDALHNRLSTADPTRSLPDQEGQRAAAINRWWGTFAEVLGYKIGAWNERQAPRSPINFTRCENGAVHIRHRSAEATFTLTSDGMRVSMRLGAFGREVILAARFSGDEHVVATINGEELMSVNAAAEHFLAPILKETFSSA